MEVESKYIRSMLQSAQAGNNAALEQLFEMNLDRIYTLSHRLTGNQPDAEAHNKHINWSLEATG